MKNSSGPYSCEQKAKFCIQDKISFLWVEVALVKARIPMLLGNNILKPLGAKIELFPEGNGVLNMKDVKIPLRETSGGHYTIRVADLGELCDCSTEVKLGSNCTKCGKSFEKNKELQYHMDSAHEHNHCNYNEGNVCSKNC